MYCYNWHDCDYIWMDRSTLNRGMPTEIANTTADHPCGFPRINHAMRMIGIPSV